MLLGQNLAGPYAGAILAIPQLRRQRCSHGVASGVQVEHHVLGGEHGRIDGLGVPDPGFDDVRDRLYEVESGFGRLTAVRVSDAGVQVLS